MARNALSDRVANSPSLILQKAWLLAALSTGLENSASESERGPASFYYTAAFAFFRSFWQNSGSSKTS